MRPKLLIMKAFGPYGGTEVIDFTILEETNMFLIHGPTGAGKTTILDAICYALYGYTNGGERTAESMRSKFAKEDEGAEVELIFAIRENEYKISRSPRFERPKKRGSGTTVEEVKATLYKKENDEYVLLAAKPQEVDKKIQELLTFNIDQFRQVIMIAQNKFRELLTAPSKERQKILQDIFETGIYQNVEKQLDMLNSSLTTKVRDKELAYQGILEHIDHEENDILKQYISTKMIGNAKDVMGILEEMIAAKEASVEENTEILIELNKKLQKLQEKLMKESERYNKYTKKLNSEKELQELLKDDNAYDMLKEALEKASKLTSVVSLEENIKTIAKEITQLKEEIEANLSTKVKLDEKLGELEVQKNYLEKDETRIEELKKEYQHLEGYRPRIESLEADKKEYKRLNEALQRLGIHYEVLEEKSKTITLQIQAFGEEIKKKDKLIKEVNEKKLLLQRVQIVLERKNEITAKENEIKETRKAFVVLRDQIGTLKVQEAAINEAYDTLFASWMKSQAGEMASSLEVNKPCPVCGSTTHPNKAVKSQENISLDQIKEKEKERLLLTGQISKAQEEQAKYLEYGMKLKNDIEEMQKKIETLMENSQEVDEKFKEELVSGIDAQTVEIERLQKLQDTLEDKKVVLENTTKEIVENREAKSGLELQLIELKTKIQAIIEELPEAFHEAEVLNNRIEIIKKELISRDEMKKALVEMLEATKLEQIRYETVIKEKKEQLKKQEESYKHKEYSFQQEKEVLAIEDQESYDKLKEILRNQEVYTHKLQAYQTQKAILTTTIKELEVELVDFMPNALEEVKSMFEKSNKEKEQLQLIQAMIMKQIEGYKENTKELEKLYTSNEELVKKQRIVGLMTQLAKGKNSKGLSFERYIQSSIFDEVLESANQKLRPMTSSRYELFRTDDMKRKNAQAGLDIAVIDHYVGEMRPVNTLSGGESFMAALALALGLADVISRLAGAATLDTMFIDEGFGTLDEEALEMSIKVLLGLQDTGRLVGIISHVRELREQIPARLEIISSKEGSRTRFRV